MTTNNGKAIIGILMAAIMIASVFAAMVPTGSATTGAKNEITVGASNSVIIGQKLMFQGTDLGFTIVGKAPDTVEGVTIGTATDSFSSTLFTTAGTYFVDSDATTPGGYDAGETTLSVADLSFTVALKIGGDTVTATTAGQILDVSVTTNIPDAAQGDIKLTKVEGSKLLTVDGAGDALENLVMGGVADPGAIGGFTLDTTGFSTGEYEIYVKTDKGEADGLSASSNTVTLTIYKEEITLTADKEEPVIDKDVKFTVQGPPDTGIVISTDETDVAEMQTGAEKVPAGVPSWDAATGEFRLDGADPGFTTNENGVFTFIMQFNDDKKVNVKVRDVADTIDDDIDIDVQARAVTLEAPSSVTIGDKFTISGTANIGSTVDVAVEGTVYAALNDLVIDENGEFSKEVDTATAGITELQVPGSVRLKAYIDRAAGAGVIGETETADGSVTILMVSEGMGGMRLHKNWNFVSVPKALSAGNSTFEQVFCNVNTSGHSIIYYNATEGWRTMNATEEVKPLRGYWIHSAEDTAVFLTYDTNPLRTPPTSQLYKGWNAIGFSDTTAASANSALTSIENNWAYLLGFDAANQVYESAIINNDATGGTHDEDNLMSPMKGYWIYVTEDCELAGISV